jgi:hypothetical protein
MHYALMWKTVGFYIWALVDLLTCVLVYTVLPSQCWVNAGFMDGDLELLHV